jgi:epsilon-lactone hydrolase
MSVRAEFLRLGLRWMVKRRSRREMDAEAIRRSIVTIKRFLPRTPNGLSAHWLDAGGVAALRVASAQSRSDRHVLYLHGGAYSFGSPSYYRMFMYRIAMATSSQVLCVKYRLAPEHPFPAALEDSVNAYRWLLDGGAEPSRIAIIGDSAGGGLAFATLLKLRDDGCALPAAAVALSPWTDLAFTGASNRVNALADPLLDADQAPVFARWYLAGADPRNPYASPLYGDLTGFPPTLIQVGSDEILRDDAVRMGDRLRDAGCAVEVEIWPRMPHVWQVFAAVVPEARHAVERIGAFVQETLGDGQRVANQVGRGGPQAPQPH